MKKIFLILGLALLAAGCDCGCFDREDALPEKALYLSVEHWNVNGPVDDHGHVKTGTLDVVKYRYEGHYYIAFHGHTPWGYTVEGEHHDPNCPECQSSGKKTPTYSPSSDYESLFGKN